MSNLRDVHICPICGGYKTHYRLHGYRCNFCDYPQHPPHINPLTGLPYSDEEIQTPTRAPMIKTCINCGVHVMDRQCLEYDDNVFCSVTCLAQHNHG